MLLEWITAQRNCSGPRVCMSKHHTHPSESTQISCICGSLEPPKASSLFQNGHWSTRKDQPLESRISGTYRFSQERPLEPCLTKQGKWDLLPGTNALRGSLCNRELGQRVEASSENRLWSVGEKRAISTIGWRTEASVAGRRAGRRLCSQRQTYLVFAIQGCGLGRKGLGSRGQSYRESHCCP